METAQHVANAVRDSYKAPAGSLRHFGRFAAVAAGFMGGLVSVANATDAKVAALRAAIAERDNKIAELSAANKSLAASMAGDDKPVSSGDPVQDWIDALAK